MSQNAAMDIPPPPPHAFHGYAGYAPAGGMAGSSTGQRASWDQYIPQPEVGGSSWKSAGSNEWDQAARANWGSSSSLGGEPLLFAALRSFSARGYHDLTQGLQDLNIQVGDVDERTQQIQGTLNQHIEDTAR